jgi:eukaryotic-like serine/threonine-protein kinase
MTRLQTGGAPGMSPAELAAMQGKRGGGRGVLILAAGIGIALGMIALFVLSRFLLH